MKELTNEEKAVLFGGATEAPFTGAYVYNEENGTYYCKNCHAVLFSSDDKFESHCGWPSFSDAVKENLGTRIDTSHNMVRTEVFCKKCGAHMGHLFDDGPKERGGARYCINSISLDFEKE